MSLATFRGDPGPSDTATASGEPGPPGANPAGPLASIPASEAFANLRSNRLGVWPDGRRNSPRLRGVASVGFEPGFELDAGEPIFTIGSCFARNIEGRLNELGFELPALRVRLPAEERVSSTANDILNKYTPQSILNELRWALEPEAGFPDQAYLKLGGGLWHDPHLAGNLAPAPLERVRQRRAMVEALYAEVPRCRVVVITLGMAEAWFDTATGLYLNEAPPQAAHRAAPDRFRFDLLSVPQIIEALDQTHELLERRGHPDFRILITVSPVPLKVTFTDRDAIAANSYSKSALRAGVEAFSRRHPRVDYVPTYEIVAHTSRESAFQEDNRHVTAGLVNAIVDRVAKSYFADDDPIDEVVGPADVRSSIKAYKRKSREGDHQEAIKALARLDETGGYEQAGYEEFDFRLRYGRALLKTADFTQADLQFARAVALRPDSAWAQFNLGVSRNRIGRGREAERAFRAAVELEPDRARYTLFLARQLFRNGAVGEAEQRLVASLAKDNDQPAAQALLAEIRKRDGWLKTLWRRLTSRAPNAALKAEDTGDAEPSPAED